MNKKMLASFCATAVLVGLVPASLAHPHRGDYPQQPQQPRYPQYPQYDRYQQPQYDQYGQYQQEEDHFSGILVGAQVGWERGNLSQIATGRNTASGTLSGLDYTFETDYSPNSLYYAIFAGYDVKLSSIVIGAEVSYNPDGTSRVSGTLDIPQAVLLGDNVPASRISTTADTSWRIDATGRIGFLATPKLLVYGRGGYSWRRITARNNDFTVAGQTLQSPFRSDTFGGFTAGGGVEYAMGPSFGGLRLRLEYRYSQLKGNLAGGAGQFATDLANALTAAGLAEASVTALSGESTALLNLLSSERTSINAHQVTFGVIYRF